MLAVTPLPSLPRKGGGNVAAPAIASVTIFACVAAATALAQPAPPNPRVTIGFVDIEGDPRHEPVRAYERMMLKTREHPFAGAQVGIEEAQALSRVLKIDFTLERIRVKSVAEVAPAVLHGPREPRHPLLHRRCAGRGIQAACARRFAAATCCCSTPPRRRIGCAASFARGEIVHTAGRASRMRMDALVQYLVSRKWRDLLVLQGPLPADAVDHQGIRAIGARNSAPASSRISISRPAPIRASASRTIPALLSAINRDYDVVFVADDAFDFARQVPYHVVRARPVVGSIDLEPVAWHWTWERNGAPQVNSRFQKLTGGRHMEAADWAAWIAVKMVVQATLRTRSADFKQQREFILGDNAFDGYKGLAVSVRPWDQQLRQAVLLATPYAVVASAPVEGFLHRSNVLDTLGDDEPETPCRLNR